MRENEIGKDISNEPPYKEMFGRDMETTSWTGSAFRGPVKRVMSYRDPTTGSNRLEFESDWVARKEGEQWHLLAATTVEDGNKGIILMWQLGGHLEFRPSDDRTLRHKDPFGEIIIYPKEKGLNSSDLVAAFDAELGQGFF